MNDVDSVRPVRVWDLPTRVFHWSLALAVMVQVVTGRIGGGALVWHIRLGLFILALLAFRLVWGLVGGRWSRFGSFVYAPATVWRYLRGAHRPQEHLEVGHNPLGSMSVLAMLLLLSLQVATGLVADDEIATTGPLNRFVANATGLAATAWHKGLGKWLLVGLVVLHVAAIVFYRARGTNLIAPMVSGDKPLGGTVPPAVDTVATRALALLLLALCAAAAAAVGWLGG